MTNTIRRRRRRRRKEEAAHLEGRTSAGTAKECLDSRINTLSPEVQYLAVKRIPVLNSKTYLYGVRSRRHARSPGEAHLN